MKKPSKLQQIIGIITGKGDIANPPNTTSDITVQPKGIKSPMPNNPNINDPILPGGRVSSPTFFSSSVVGEENLRIIDPIVWLEFIPMIRRYIYSNPNLSQALNNIVELGNTGHEIRFDKSVSTEQAVKMRSHLELKQQQWFAINAGIDGFVNKLFAQIMISGALSCEWVPDLSLKTIKTVVMVDPETVRWVYDKPTGNYMPYQKLFGTYYIMNNGQMWIKLNPNSFKYFALNGDSDNPYGIPPYLPTLDALETQKLMLDNIKFIMEEVGVMGFLEVLMDKPEQNGGESFESYKARLIQFLDDAKDKVRKGYRNGITVGYKDDTEFKFHPTSKDHKGVEGLFQLNEVLFASGIKQDPGMLGKNYGSSESQITIIFTKLVAQLKNIQQLVKFNLEYGYGLELRLAGFKFNSITVTFKPTTALDRLKDEQANEIKIRNLMALYYDGIISLADYAHEMGYEEPDQTEPRMVRVNVAQDAADAQDVIDKKGKSAKKTRDKNKHQPKKVSNMAGYITCPHCSALTSDVEAGMGYIKCIQCKETITQSQIQ